MLADSNRIYVLDPAAFGVHQFDRRGRWISTIGGRGDGPGEFRRPVAMGRLSDTLWVADRGRSRLSFFGVDGVYLRSVRFSIISGPTVVMPQRAFSGRRIASVPYLSAGIAGQIDSLPILLFDEDGTVQDTIAWQTLGQVTVSIATREENGGSDVRTMSINHPFDRRSLLAYDPRSRGLYLGTWRADSAGAAELELLQLASTGDTAAVAHLPLGRATLSTRDVRSYATRIHGDLPGSFRSRVSASELARAFMQQIAKPAETAVDAMIASENRTIWLRRTDRASVAAPEYWTAYRFGEGFTELIQLPIGHQLVAASGHMLWTVSRDELDLPTVTGWVPASPGADSWDRGFSRNH
ncbi:6-bladed beta-propeller [Candidatus Palauibacter sp.]|uniref:6-bladed beta-propeller n=1 Tax=Candidatus Palauibacter sp. TaxID=3101350 RepID=UPI003B01955D